ncbi:MAG: MFS transporter [Motilibacteraceae bacterium]
MPLLHRPFRSSASAPALPRDARVLLVGVAVDALGAGLALPFLVVYLHDVRHLTLSTVGLIAAVPAVVALVLLGPMGVLIDRFGARRVQVVALAAQVVGMLAMSQVRTAPLAFLAQGLVGVGHAAFWPANQALVSTIVPEERRQRYFGLSFSLLNAGIGVGGIAGAAFVTVTHPGTFQLIYVLDGLSFLAPLAILLGPLRHVGNAHAEHHREPGSYREVLADSPFRRALLLSFASSLVGYGMMEAGWTGFARTVGEASTRTIGLAFAGNTAAIVVFQMLVISRIQGRRRTRVMAALGGVWAIAWLVMGLAGLVPGTWLSAVLLVTSLVIFGLGETLLSPVAPALTNSLATDRLRGRYNAAASTAFQVGAIVAPATAGFLLQARLSLLFVVLLLLGCAFLSAVALRLERHLPAAANGLAPHDDAVRLDEAAPPAPLPTITAS